MKCGSRRRSSALLQERRGRLAGSVRKSHVLAYRVGCLSEAQEIRFSTTPLSSGGAFRQKTDPRGRGLRIGHPGNREGRSLRTRRMGGLFLGICWESRTLRVSQGSRWVQRWRIGRGSSSAAYRTPPYACAPKRGSTSRRYLGLRNKGCLAYGNGWRFRADRVLRGRERVVSLLLRTLAKSSLPPRTVFAFIFPFWGIRGSTRAASLFSAFSSRMAIPPRMNALSIARRSAIVSFLYTMEWQFSVSS